MHALQSRLCSRPKVFFDLHLEGVIRDQTMGFIKGVTGNQKWLHGQSFARYVGEPLTNKVHGGKKW
jgi:hypothetical protein